MNPLLERKLGAGLGGLNVGKRSNVSNKDRWEPVDWQAYFNKKLVVSVGSTSPADKFVVYVNGSQDLLDELDHESQRSTISSACNSSVQVAPVVLDSLDEDDRFIFVLVHGGGHSALSWALCARQIALMNVECIAYDMRSHGETTCSTDENDLSIGRLCHDLESILVVLFGGGKPERRKRKIVLCGHSAGGSNVIHTAANADIRKRLSEHGIELVGLVVLDVVEGTAMAALPAMQAILNKRPGEFSHPSDAIKWAVQSGQTCNAESARVSIPPQLRPTDTSQHAWRTDLASTEQFWRGWFEGLSDKFLKTPGPKLLLLAGTDRLDKPLTVGQMQGKFQLIVNANTGHLIQEDQPAQTARQMVSFAKRQCRPFKLPNKIQAK